MAKAKEGRNREFIKAWKEEGLSDKQLQERFGLSEGGVKGLKARLRAKDSSLYTEKRPELSKVEREVAKASGGLIKFAGEQVDKSTSPLVHKRATYYLSPETIRKIKQIALNREKDASEIVRKALSEWISGLVDK